MHRIIRFVAVGALASSVAVAVPAGADSHLEVVLTGVDNGRGLTFADDGTLYVASSGIGDPAFTSEGYDTDAAMCAEGPEGGASCYGETGALFKVPSASTVSGTAADGFALRSSIPSHAGMGGAEGIGAADVSLSPDGTTLYYTMGLGADPAARDALQTDGATNADQFATLRSIGTDGTGDTEVADIGDFEAAEDPDLQLPDSNPFGLVAGTSSVTVLDSGGNTVLEVALPGGGVSVGAVVPPVFVPAPPFLGLPVGTNIPAQAVPTGLADAGGGQMVFGQLTGFPFATGAASVWSYDGDGAMAWYAGFTNIIDVAVGPDGNTYVLEIAHDGLLAAGDGPPMGALTRLVVDGDEVTRELLLDDVVMPGGMAFDPTDEGVVYMTTGSAGPDGTVVRFDAGGAEPLVSVTDDSATITEDQRLVAGDATPDDFTTVVPDVTANDVGVVEVTPLGVAAGAVASGSIVYQPRAHFTGTDNVPYRACNADGDCVNGVLTVTVEQTATDRIAGENRILTAVEASMSRFPDGAAAVVVARSDLYPDALAGGPLAKAAGGPILLTPGDALDPATAAEIQRLGASTVYVLGGANAISDAVFDAVEALVPGTTRVFGENRFATAAAIRDALEDVVGVPSTNAYVVEGYDPDPNRGWPDAVAVSALAAWQGQPILLVETDRLPDETAAALDGIDATVIGGPVAISDAIRAAIDAAADTMTEIAGTTRYHTSQLIAEAGLDVNLRGVQLSLVSGGNWPDALVAGPLAAGNPQHPLLLVHPTDLAQSPEAVAFIEDNGPFADVDLFGGPVAISTAVEAGVAAANQ